MIHVIECHVGAILIIMQHPCAICVYNNILYADYQLSHIGRMGIQNEDCSEAPRKGPSP